MNGMNWKVKDMVDGGVWWKWKLMQSAIDRDTFDETSKGLLHDEIVSQMSNGQCSKREHCIYGHWSPGFRALQYLLGALYCRLYGAK